MEMRSVVVIRLNTWSNEERSRMTFTTQILTDKRLFLVLLLLCLCALSLSLSRSTPNFRRRYGPWCSKVSLFYRPSTVGEEALVRSFSQ